MEAAGSPEAPSEGVRLAKPRFRGVSHELAFYASLLTGPLLVMAARPAARPGTAVYAFTMTALFGVSAVYHRHMWRPKVRRRLGRLDSTMILTFTAGTFTPIALALGSSWARTTLVIVWASAGIGALSSFFPLALPKGVVVIPYLALGWLGISLAPEAFHELGPLVPILIALGGAAYTLGAVTYARRSPDPWPERFGYHEIFHACVVLAAYLHYAAIAVTVA